MEIELTADTKSLVIYALNYYQEMELSPVQDHNQPFVDRVTEALKWIQSQEPAMTKDDKRKLREELALLNKEIDDIKGEIDTLSDDRYEKLLQVTEVTKQLGGKL